MGQESLELGLRHRREAVATIADELARGGRARGAQEGEERLLDPEGLEGGYQVARQQDRAVRSQSGGCRT